MFWFNTVEQVGSRQLLMPLLGWEGGQPKSSRTGGHLDGRTQGWGLLTWQQPLREQPCWAVPRVKPAGHGVGLLGLTPELGLCAEKPFNFRKNRDFLCKKRVSESLTNFSAIFFGVRKSTEMIRLQLTHGRKEEPSSRKKSLTRPPASPTLPSLRRSCSQGSTRISAGSGCQEQALRAALPRPSTCPGPEGCTSSAIGPPGGIGCSGDSGIPKP